MRHIAAIVLTAFLAACGSQEDIQEATPPTVDAPTLAPTGAKITFASVDPSGKTVSQEVDATAYNRMVTSKWNKMKAFQSGGAAAVKALEVAQQAVGAAAAGVIFQGNAGPGCWPYDRCPEHPYAICLDSDTWVYNMHNGYAQNPWDYRLVIGCFRGTAWATQAMGTLWAPAVDSGNPTNTWAYQSMSVWAGTYWVGFNSSSDSWVATGYCVDAQIGCNVPADMRQVGAWAQRDWGRTWDSLINGGVGRYVVRLYHYH